MFAEVRERLRRDRTTWADRIKQTEKALAWFDDRATFDEATIKAVEELPGPR